MKQNVRPSMYHDKSTMAFVETHCEIEVKHTIKIMVSFKKVTLRNYRLPLIVNPTLVNPEPLLIQQTFFRTDFHFSVFLIFDKPTIYYPT